MTQKKMKIVFAVPVYGNVAAQFMTSMLSLQKALMLAGVEFGFLVLSGLCYVSQARALLAADFLKTDGTDLFFIDADMAFPPESAVKLILRQEDVVGGAYRKRSEKVDYAVSIMTTEDGIPIGRDGLIEATGLATGFLKIKRHVLERMAEAYPELKYRHKDQDVYDFFNTGVENGMWWGDDFAFCRRWSKIGGRLWVLPDLELDHIDGTKSFKGNYHEYLLTMPGGARYESCKDGETEAVHGGGIFPCKDGEKDKDRHEQEAAQGVCV